MAETMTATDAGKNVTSVYMGPELRAAMQDVAEREGRSLSAQIRHILNLWMAAYRLSVETAAKEAEK